MSRESSLAKNTGILAIGTFLPKIASFVTLPILTGCLTKDEYGTYDLIIVLVSLLLPAITLQIQTAAFRFLIDKRNKAESVSAIVTTIFAFIVPLSLVTLVVMYFCMYKYDPIIRIGICGYFFADLLVNATRQIIRGLSQNLKYSISAIISSGGQLILIALLVWKLNTGLLGAIVSLAIAETVSFIYLFLSSGMISYIKPKMLSKALLEEMLKYSWPMVPNSMSMWVMRMSDRLVVTAIMGPAANAVYSVANKIPQLLTIAQNTFTMAWQENASIVSRDEDAGKYYSSMYRTMFDLMAGFMCLIIACVPVLFVIFIRGDYDEAYIQIPILLLAMFFFAMSSFFGGIYVAYMKTKSVGITTMVAAALNLIIDLGLIHWIGLYAATLSTLISYIFLFVYRLIDSKKVVNLEYDFGHMAWVFIIMLTVTGMCMMQNTIVNIINFVVSCVIFVLLNRSFVLTLFTTVRKKLKR